MISNNWVENAIRPSALGRKNWLFSAMVKGAHSSARIYSLLQTAKENGKARYPYLVNLLKNYLMPKLLPTSKPFCQIDRIHMTEYSRGGLWGGHAMGNVPLPEDVRFECLEITRIMSLDQLRTAYPMLASLASHK